MTLGEFFWLDDAKFAAKLSHCSDAELIMGDKHNVRKRKGGKLGAWVGTAQAPMTMGISFIGTGIGVRNRAVAKRRLEMIHAELARRGLQKHAETWRDSVFAAMAVGAGAAVGMGFAPGAEAAAQEFAEVGAMHAAQYATGLATSQVAQNLGSAVTEITTSHFTDPDTYFLRPKAIETGNSYYGQATLSPLPAYGAYGGQPALPQRGMPTHMSIPPAPYYS